MKETLGQVLTERRKQLNISQRMLAKATGIANSTISRIEMGLILHPDAPTMRLLAKHLSMDYNYILALAGYVNDDPEERMIQRVLAYMPKAKKEEIISYLSSNYPEYFTNDTKE